MHEYHVTDSKHPVEGCEECRDAAEVAEGVARATGAIAASRAVQGARRGGGALGHGRQLRLHRLARRLRARKVPWARA